MKKKILRLKYGKTFEFKGGTIPERKEGKQSREELIENFLHENYTDPKLNAHMLAQKMNLSVRHMNRIVNGFYGVTFYQLLTGIRLEAAKELLLKGTMTVKEVALSVGYDSSTGFFVAFKKRYGITPGSFCEKSRKKTEK